MSDTQSPRTEQAPRRLIAALFLMALGYALLSVCLFRILSFETTNTAFFLLYVSVGMPVGAFWARQSVKNPASALGSSILHMIAFAALMPLMPLFMFRHSRDITQSLLIREVRLWEFFPEIAYMVLLTGPFFALWGRAEFLGYETAIRSNRARRSFYLIFIWAMAAALVIGNYWLPAFGWLRTVGLAPIIGVAARDMLRPGAPSRQKRIIPFIGAAIFWVIIGEAETPFVRMVCARSAAQAVNILETGSDKPASGNPRFLKHRWGRYCHTLYEQHSDGRNVTCLYNGSPMWHTITDGNYIYDFEKAVFSLIKPGADVCIIGSGGGKQVSMALERNPREVVAIDVIPEIFDDLKGDLAWTNNRAYLDPRVKTVAMDGRQYLATCGRKFDFILAPHTESVTAIMKILFEPGHQLHTVEGFEAAKKCLKPDGVFAIFKLLDKHEKLFNSYSRTLKEAGFSVAGWTLAAPPQPMNWIVILASPERRVYDIEKQGMEYFAARGWRYVDFDVAPPGGDVIHDDSPWRLGLLGLFLTADARSDAIICIVGPCLLAFGAALALGMRKLRPGESRLRVILFLLAGAAVGVNAVYVENAIIFWLVRNMLNPMSAFFAGACVFLALWGLSSLGLNKWHIVAAAGIAGMGGILLLPGRWDSAGGGICLLLMTLGGGLLFPLLGITFKERLLDLFVTDALGGLAGGLMGIWLPVAFGFVPYYNILPLVWIVALVLAALAVGGARRAG
ncbi:MAG TPA: hypothetical protein PL033_17925 [Candidatus Brocadiia bacterium]|nr:hypothetical protein [Candidatus Brocadiia bacterium]